MQHVCIIQVNNSNNSQCGHPKQTAVSDTNDRHWSSCVTAAAITELAGVASFLGLTLVTSHNRNLFALHQVRIGTYTSIVFFYSCNST